MKIIFSLLVYVILLANPTYAQQRGDTVYLCTSDPGWMWLTPRTYRACPVTVLSVAGNSIEIVSQEHCQSFNPSLSRGQSTWTTMNRIWSTRSSCVNQGQSARPADLSIYVSNICSGPKRFFVRTQNLSGDWINSGWYDFKPGETSMRLLRDGSALQTRNRVIYFYMENRAGEMMLRGEHNVSFNGRTYAMYKFTSNSTPLRINLCG